MDLVLFTSLFVFFLRAANASAWTSDFANVERIKLWTGWRG